MEDMMDHAWRRIASANHVAQISQEHPAWDLPWFPRLFSAELLLLKGLSPTSLEHLQLNLKYHSKTKEIKIFVKKYFIAVPRGDISIRFGLQNRIRWNANKVRLDMIGVYWRSGKLSSMSMTTVVITPTSGGVKTGIAKNEREATIDFWSKSGYSLVLQGKITEYVKC